MRGAAVRQPGGPAPPAQPEAGRGGGSQYLPGHQRAARGRAGGPPGTRRGPLHRAADPGGGRPGGGVPDPGVRPGFEAVCAGGLAAPHQPLRGRRPGTRPAAQTGLGPVGKSPPQGQREGQRRGGTVAGCLRPARGQAGLRLRRLRPRLRAVRRRLPLRGNPRPAGHHRRGATRYAEHPGDGPAGLRRRGLRQDRGGHAGRVPGHPQRQAGGGAGAHHPAGAAAFQLLQRPLCRLGRHCRGGVEVQVRQAIERGDPAGGRG